MISWLKGKIQHISKNNLILDVNGVGYDLLVSSSISEANLKVGQQKQLVVYTDVKENAINLFGFNSVSEREVFLLLKKVKGVGSKLAMGIISSVGAVMVLKAIGREDISILTSVPGVGKKSAERIILELREKVDTFTEGSNDFANKGLSSKIEIQSLGKDAILALERLGFNSSQAQKAVNEVLKLNKTVSSSEILRKALAII